jgi:hypothetical protein
MSLIVTTYVPEGIIIAGDSRLTINWSEVDPETKGNNHYSITSTDSNRKVFQIKDKFGLATFGAADIKGIPISGYITQFIEEKIDDNTQIDEIPSALHDFFGKGLEHPQTSFYVAGYKIEDKVSVPYVYFISIARGTTSRVNFQNGNIIFNANWGGELEVMSRLMSNIQMKQDNEWTEVKAPEVPFYFFTLQDAIDFSLYAVRTTIETFRFQQRIRTVGGPIDILAIFPKGIRWIYRKELGINNIV